ncbi:MAG: Rid family hydrolase [Candidatus Saccharimonadales bacterium]
MSELIKNSNTPIVGPYVPARLTYGPTLYISGQIGINPETGKLVSDSVVEQAHQVMQNLGAILGATATHLGFNPEAVSFGNALKCSIFLTDVDTFGLVNQVYSEYFPDGNYPARACVGAQIPFPGALVEIDMVAEIPEASEKSAISEAHVVPNIPYVVEPCLG